MRFAYVHEDDNPHTSGHCVKTRFRGKWYTVADAFSVPTTTASYSADYVAKRINDLLNEHGLVPKPTDVGHNACDDGSVIPLYFEVIGCVYQALKKAGAKAVTVRTTTGGKATVKGDEFVVIVLAAPTSVYVQRSGYPEAQVKGGSEIWDQLELLNLYGREVPR